MLTSERLVIENLLDKASLALDEIYNPEPIPQAPHEVMLKVHTSFQDLIKSVKVGAGKKEAGILAACSNAIAEITSLAVYFERNRCRSN